MWKDFKWVEKRFGTKFANILKGVKDIAEEGGQEISNHFINSETGEVTFKDLDDNNHILVTTESLQDEDSPVKELFDESVTSILAKNGLIEVKWQELKDKRDNGQLIPGSLYRITDYNCTTVQENTQSAGHQFDIVLLALSKDKLAEEGWAMMNESNIYDVTFADGVTKKCWVYIENINDGYNIVAIDSLLGISGIVDGDWVVNEDTKSITMNELSSADIAEENLPYNYFQNSNLSAWKVWYCLDNDTDRFAWADDKIRLKINVNGDVYITTGRFSVLDKGEYLYWGQQYKDGGAAVYSKGTPKIGDSVYTWTGSPSSPTWITLGIVEEIEITNGRGVIYRLIDEFNNDIKYDFKNIQFMRTITDGQYDENGTETWCYTLNIWYNDMCQDASIVGNTLSNDEGYVKGVYDNVFGYTTVYDFYLDGVNTFAFALGNNVVLSFDEGGEYYGIYSNTIGNDAFSNTIGNSFYSNTIGNNFNNKTISDNTSYKNYGNNGVELATNIVEETYSLGSLKANKMYNFGEVTTALTIPSLDATNDLVSNALNFYALRFIAGADNLNITFPTGVIVDDTPTINTGDYVEIMINLYVENNTNHFYASIKVWQA